MLFDGPLGIGEAVAMWSRLPPSQVQASAGSAPIPPEVVAVSERLDAVLGPIGFAAGQAGVSGDESQVIFCRGEVEGVDDGCVDLVVELAAKPEWHITDVRYWGFPSDRWHLAVDREADLPGQVAGLVRTLPATLGPGSA